MSALPGGQGSREEQKEKTSEARFSGAYGGNRAKPGMQQAQEGAAFISPKGPRGKNRLRR